MILCRCRVFISRLSENRTDDRCKGSVNAYSTGVYANDESHYGALLEMG